MTGEFEDLFDGELLKEEKDLVPEITDHDYVMHPTRSPAGSDSGVSLDSSGNSPRNVQEDLTQFCNDLLSESPGSDMSHLSPEMMHGTQSPGSVSDHQAHSPDSTNNVALDALKLEHFDFSEIEGMSFDTVDPSALDNDGMELMDEDVSIDIGNKVILNSSLGVHSFLNLAMHL